MTDTKVNVDRFFAQYAPALLARDEQAIGRMYAVPALILFPDNAIPVSDASQTEQFFASAWAQYDDIDAAEPEVAIMGEAPGSVWAVVTWTANGRYLERFCYQLVERPDGYQIAVLTPMDDATAGSTAS